MECRLRRRALFSTFSCLVVVLVIIQFTYYSYNKLYYYYYVKAGVVGINVKTVVVCIYSKIGKIINVKAVIVNSV